MSKETLEEFIKRQLTLGKYQNQESAIKYSIELGAKWQAERMYSEEEVLDILFKHTEDMLKGIRLTLTEWFKQHKKK
jgi:Arc/MetJ-type ribon-helix-helix transcriptional regulator